MTNRIGLGINLSHLPKTLLQSFKNLDWKVKACFAAALVLIVAGAGLAMSSRSLANRTATLTLRTTTLDQLGFTPEELKQAIHVPEAVNGSALQKWLFADVCTDFLSTIQRKLNAHPEANSITMNDTSEAVLQFMDFGLPNNTSYKDADALQKKQSWGHMFLQRLVDKQLIADFPITYAPKQVLHHFIEERTLSIQIK